MFSKDALKKISDAKKGNKNPMKRAEVRDKLKRTLAKPDVKLKWSKDREGKRPNITGNKNPMFGKKRPDLVLYNKEFKKGSKRPDQSERMKNGGAAYSNSFIKNPSKPQVELFNLVGDNFNNVVLNYPCLNYSIDIVIIDLKIAIEYDEPYWHVDKDKDEFRQKRIEKEGWQFLRYSEIPIRDKLMNDIRRLKNGRGKKPKDRKRQQKANTTPDQRRRRN